MEVAIVCCALPTAGAFLLALILYPVWQDWQQRTPNSPRLVVEQPGDSLVAPEMDELWPLLHVPVHVLVAEGQAQIERTYWAEADFKHICDEHEIGVN
jgi:hypothetical protein